MKQVESDYKSQSRWNDGYGKSGLAVIRDTPEKFIIEPGKLSRQKLDLIEVMANMEKKEILEFGSGRGEFSVALAKLGGVVTGIDIGEDLVKLANKIAEVNNVKCNFVVGNIGKLPFENETFDYVVGNAILHHLPGNGVIDSLKEAYRVLKPRGMALFTEPVENSRIFDFMQNLFPVGKGTLQYRPSILQREEWAAYLEKADDRDLSNTELNEAKGCFKDVEFKYYGLLFRLIRLIPAFKYRKQSEKILNIIDSFLTHRYSPVKKLSQAVLVVYRK